MKQKDPYYRVGDANLVPSLHNMDNLVTTSLSLRVRKKIFSSK